LQRLDVIGIFLILIYASYKKHHRCIVYNDLSHTFVNHNKLGYAITSTIVYNTLCKAGKKTERPGPNYFFVYPSILVDASS
jgi:hypothetical protein